MCLQAFGSNLNPAKVADRRMAPLHAVRGVLPGWSLLFNHRGGYGNIESAAAIAEQRLDLTRLSPAPEPEPEPYARNHSAAACDGTALF